MKAAILTKTGFEIRDVPIPEYGAGRLTAVDPLDWRRRMALDLGANETLAPDSEEIEKHKREYGAMDGACDVVVEATGIQPGIDLSGCLVKQHGLINLVGHHYSDGGMRTIYMNQWNVKAIDVVNGHVRRRGEKAEEMRRGSGPKKTGAQHQLSSGSTHMFKITAGLERSPCPRDERAQDGMPAASPAVVPHSG